MKYITARDYLLQIKEDAASFKNVDDKFKHNIKFLALANVVNPNVTIYFDDEISEVLAGSIESTTDAGVDRMYEIYLQEKDWRYHHIVIDQEKPDYNTDSDTFLYSKKETERKINEKIEYYEAIIEEATIELEKEKAKLVSNKLS